MSLLTLVTGCAGFIEFAVGGGAPRRGSPYGGSTHSLPTTTPSSERANVVEALANRRFEFVEADLRSASLEPLLDGVDVVFHLAAQPGVRVSWSDGFPVYVEHNILATQRLLEAFLRIR